MIASSFVIMVVGMAVVFSFLILLVISMSVLSAVVQKFFPEKEEEAPAPSSAQAEIAAAIAVAFSKS